MIISVINHMTSFPVHHPVSYNREQRRISPDPGNEQRGTAWPKDSRRPPSQSDDVSCPDEYNRLDETHRRGRPATKVPEDMHIDFGKGKTGTYRKSPSPCRKEEEMDEDVFNRRDDDQPLRQPDSRKSGTGAHNLRKHPDEYNLVDERNQRSRGRVKGSDSTPRDAATVDPVGSKRRPLTGVQAAEGRTITGEHGKPKPRHRRHPPPPSPQSQIPKEKSRKANEPPQRQSSLDRDDEILFDQYPDGEGDYINLPGLIRPGSQPWEEGFGNKPEMSERSNGQNSYDPRVSDETLYSQRKATDTVKPDHEAEGDARRFHAARDSERTTPHAIPLPSQRRNKYANFDDDGYVDEEDSDEDLRPPALRKLPHKGKHTEAYRKPIPPGTDFGHPMDSAQYRDPTYPDRHYGDRHVHGSSKHGPLSPGGMSAPSFPGHDEHPYRYSQRYADERVSRPRSKRATATSQASNLTEAHGSKHSMIISTKRRTLSGVTGTSPAKPRSSSMNALWFSNHAIPSAELTSPPDAALRLSTVQLQAQAVLECRHRSGSRGHSLDRRSGASSLGGTASRYSTEGYEAQSSHRYNTRGRLIHGGGRLKDNAESRRRHMQDGHESLSRVWIPSSEVPTTQRPMSKREHERRLSKLSSGGLDRQTNLNESAVAFALTNFNTNPGRIGQRLPGDGGSDEDNTLSTISEHIYETPSNADVWRAESGNQSLLNTYAPRHSQYQLERRATSLLLDWNSEKSRHTNRRMGHKTLRRPKLEPDRWGSVPLPTARQYDSLVRLSRRSLNVHGAQSTSVSNLSKYILESNI